MTLWRIRNRAGYYTHPFAVEKQVRFLCWKWWKTVNVFQSKDDAKYEIAHRNEIIFVYDSGAKKVIVDDTW